MTPDDQFIFDHFLGRLGAQKLHGPMFVIDLPGFPTVLFVQDPPCAYFALDQLCLQQVTWENISQLAVFFFFFFFGGLLGEGRWRSFLEVVLVVDVEG